MFYKSLDCYFMKKMIATMESILDRVLEYILKYWLKSSCDQYKLHGYTIQLSNLDVDGDSLHANIGLSSALAVTATKVGKLRLSFGKAAAFADLAIGI